MNSPEPAWDDLKVAFSIDDDELVWAASEASQLPLPPGWELDGTDGTGARYVAVFRVHGVPTVEDAASVRAMLDNLQKEITHAKP